MQKLLIYWVCGASLLLSGCTSLKEAGNAIPDALNRLPLIHRPDIQQGNVVTQEAIDRLKPGMSKSQVRYILGTPMLVDAFHQDRWDYYYSMQKGREEPIQERAALFFSDDRLIRIEGDYRPRRAAEIEQTEAAEEDTVITVPDYTGEHKGLFTRTLEAVGIESNE